ncbi:shikimate dehydrogenase [Roseobacter sp. HKCCD9010]|uniref:shikimate dehydrogenase n=1 Tax=unclassified Roseobacter TaxID=196798 RepID=UPI0014914E97|nr:MULTISPECIES: shikimate dehydrogenase [unclassified Roseobacter]MBF9048445.1 shikimate dehydrogenase [Rhodobacterales bacterium HKCCD4356]NNV10444.1 shikimate dehydrogenase [Roseobacter sp. HKCCD7357]NNV14629.1 shikimate dehydrogenase [Roseobacter sp. HKCCD8768]NNV24088.1 shikimate dehydrogenase [Roseobacter sp. HKCCD8192]NNV28345.1 shikimate dehydrogenase [Roseobacter sp. HKCCD9061]
MSNDLLLAGVIGDPIAHSKSPVLHGHWLKRYGIDGHYVPLKVGHKDLKKCLRLLPRMGFRGINVTIPHKEQVLALADSVTDRAALIGAANTITFLSNGTIQADNTDGVGFLQNLHQNAPDWRADTGPALVLGAGGAARAIVSALLTDGAPEVIVVNRTRARGEALRDQLGARVNVMDWTRIPDLLPEIDCLVNTTSLGMENGQPLNIDLSKIRPEALVTDIVYTPLHTPLLNLADAIGCPTVDGLGMLLHQAVPGFERWFGKLPEVDEDLRQAVLSA